MSAEFTYSKRFLAFSCAKIWLKSFGWTGVLVYTVAGALAICTLNDSDIRIVGMLMLTVLCTAILIYVGIFLEQLRRVLRLAAMTVTISWDTEMLHIRTPMGSSDMKWNGFLKVRLFQEVWAFFVPASSYFLIPTSCLSKEDRDFILEKLRLAKVKVV
jgi:hypothetical protein